MNIPCYLIPAIGDVYVACADRLVDSIRNFYPDANITVQINGKGTGSVETSKLAITSNEITANGAANTSAGYIICNKGTALAVSLADGTVIGETKFFSNKGAGDATITPANMAGGTSVTIEQFEAFSFIWDGANWYIYANYSGTLNP